MSEKPVDTAVKVQEMDGAQHEEGRDEVLVAMGMQMGKKGNREAGGEMES